MVSDTTVFNDLSGTANGVSFTFDVEITSTATISFGGSGPSSDGPILRFGNASHTDNLTFTLSDIQATGGSVVFDSWSGGSRFDGGGTNLDDWDIGGQTITGGSGSFSIGTPVTPSVITISSIDDGANENTRLHSLDLNFTGTAVPEPTSAVLFGVGLLAGFRRRKRAN